MKIFIPKEIEHYTPELEFFLNLMVRKLHTNRHKGFANDTLPRDLFVKLQEEIKELETALADESQFDVALECVDVANFAWLLALVVLRMDKEKFDESKYARFVFEDGEWKMIDEALNT